MLYILGTFYAILYLLSTTVLLTSIALISTMQENFFYVLTKWDNWYSEINGYKLFTHYLLSRWSGVKGPWYFWWGICPSKAHKPVTLWGNPIFWKSLMTLEGRIWSQKKQPLASEKKWDCFLVFNVIFWGGLSLENWQLGLKM